MLNFARKHPDSAKRFMKNREAAKRARTATKSAKEAWIAFVSGDSAVAEP